jgi:hypothetical protein
VPTDVTAADFVDVPEPVATVARALAAGEAAHLDLLRAMWRHRNVFTEPHYVATKLYLNQQFGREIKGTHRGRWPFLVKVIEQMLTVENAGEHATPWLLREGTWAVRLELGFQRNWSWKPGDPTKTVTTLLGLADPADR